MKKPSGTVKQKAVPDGFLLFQKDDQYASFSSSQLASDLERGRMGASVETICRICQVLGITTDQLLLGRQPEPGITARQMESLLRGVSPCYHPHLLAILREEIKLIGLAEGQR